MKLSPQVLGFIRSVASVAIWGLSSAVLTYLSDASNLTIVNGSLAILIAGIAGLIEHQLEKNGKGALFGAANRA